VRAKLFHADRQTDGGGTDRHDEANSRLPLERALKHTMLWKIKNGVSKSPVFLHTYILFYEVFVVGFICFKKDVPPSRILPIT
jgi:hypothetical protein